MSERRAATPQTGASERQLYRQLSSPRMPEVVAPSSFSPTALIADMSPSSTDLHYTSSQPDPSFDLLNRNITTSNDFSPISPLLTRNLRRTSQQRLTSLSSSKVKGKDSLITVARIRSVSAGGSPPVTPSHLITAGTISTRNSTSSSGAAVVKAVTPTEHNDAAFIKAKKENDSMIYIDGPQVYTCSHCRTHLTSHDDIISKSFHGRHGRAYLLAQCVNVVTGPEEKRRLMTGLHVVCDIFCKRCNGMVGWTYTKAYEPSQKYKEGKFIIEKINLHLEESSYYTISHPAGERDDRWRKRSMSWGSEHSSCSGSYGYNHQHDMVYEYRPEANRSLSFGDRNFDSPGISSSSPYRRRTMSNLPTESSQPVLPDLSPSADGK